MARRPRPRFTEDYPGTRTVVDQAALDDLYERVGELVEEFGLDRVRRATAEFKVSEASSSVDL